MRFTTALSGAFVAAASVVDAVGIPEIHAKKQTQTTVVTGVTGNGVQQRVELRTMQQNNPDQFSLYIQGLREFMNVDQSDPLSYYQIAGIHGRPYSPWEGWTSAAGSGGYGGGYCTHVSNIFLTWHRPYLALFEQVLYGHVQNVANSYPAATKARFQAAAKNFRIPYWDWAAVPTCSGCQPYPLLVQNMYITVTTPSGSQSVLNPLFRYDFHPISANDMVYNPFAQWGVTKRYPTSWDQNGVSQNNLIAPQIANNRASFADRLYNLFTNPAYNNFTMFSNEAWQASSGMSGADSIESIHDAIHSITGSNGHMTYLDYSAFDPIFWLHHTNIDRLWDMWTAIKGSSSYVTRAPAQGSTYTYPSGTQIDANFGLKPWAKDGNRNLFTSQDVRSTLPFFYSYPETQNANSGSVTAAVNRLYGSSNGNSKRNSKRDNSHHYHYIANIVSQKFQLKGSYAVYMFLGDPGSDSSKWPVSSNLVGTHGVSANLADEQNTGMSNMDLPITGTIPLTTTLLSKVSAGQLKDMTPQTVEDYLKSTLTWRVAMLDGTIVPSSQVPGLSVTVVTSDVQPPKSETDFPQWGAFASMANVTTGQDGGHDDSWWGGELTWSLSELISAGLSINRNRN
ncbi:Di-copper centre-containing protein [Myriangium duriaei CBS 260.36]|uniref:tyrosinase n=1 Tax=Myriangium duriaei CBS 260.36 TaxID=1168546 RepID=A0A9P4J5B3_9PEZI|nr:Di-copper centre-containing protein [Myriangium duriaei CBS 260.36]